jgi:hypothetical protein
MHTEAGFLNLKENSHGTAYSACLNGKEVGLDTSDSYLNS